MILSESYPFDTLVSVRYRKRGRNMTKVTGFGLIATAVTVIIYSIPGFPKIESPLGPLFPVALLIFFTIENLMKKDYKSSLISALIGLMIANAIYDLLPIPTETLIVAGILVGLELGCLFPDHDNEKNKH